MTPFKKNDFPIFSRPYNGKQLMYLDSAATSQKPQQVIDALSNFYAYQNSNIHRGIYKLSEDATALYENIRTTVAQFLNAREAREIIFTHGATEGINLVAYSWARKHLKAGDEILLTVMEHHANLLPWQRIAHEQGVVLKFIPVHDDACPELSRRGTLDLEKLDELLSHRTKLVSVVHVSHVLGTHNDIDLITQRAHAVGARVLIDAVQSVPHQKIDVQKVGADFLVFSGHKVLGPTGVGVLYARKEIHDQLEPYQLGGGTIVDADFLQARFLPVPHRLEAGTPPIAQVIGLGVAINYLQENTNFRDLQRYEAALCAQLIDGLVALPKIKLLGPLDQLKQQGHIVNFVVDGFHAHDVAAFLDTHGICVRAGHHCAQPFAKAFNIDASVRVSFYGYNSMDEVNALINALKLLV